MTTCTSRACKAAALIKSITFNYSITLLEKLVLTLQIQCLEVSDTQSTSSQNSSRSLYSPGHPAQLSQCTALPTLKFVKAPLPIPPVFFSELHMKQKEL